MTPGRERGGRFRDWLSGLFPPTNDNRCIPDGHQDQEGPQDQGGPGGLFSQAQNFALHNPTMTSVHGNQYTTFVQGDYHSIVPRVMSLLSQHTIPGAAHDDSAREPPPRCYPGTRVKLVARITAWFDGQAPQELILWISGPARVGKSAIVQTFAEYLVQSKSLGASLFISRLKKRNNPHGVFITIAYQLATRIEAYRNFIVEQLSLDPSLLDKGMAAQFKTFIVEPFVEKKVGADEKRWGILLDGLDELEGEDAQCEIIQLISTFVLEHRDAPLMWIITSRPESYISNVFDDDEVRRREYVPINSTEACEDVEHYLRSSFKTTQKKFQHSVPSDWPSKNDFLKLTAAAAGLFVYAEVVMQFIRDPDHADPVSRLELLLTLIGRSNAITTNDNPFVHLDALYHEILSSIPSTLWPTAKRLLSFTIHEEQIQTIFNFPLTLPKFQTLRGMSVLFGITRYTIYACLNKCRSTLKIPDWQVAHNEKLTLLHPSFAEYLKDPSRSGNFHVGNVKEVQEDAILSLLGIWNKCSGDDTALGSVETAWRQYCAKLNDKSPSKFIAEFHAKLFRTAVYGLRRVVYRILGETAKSPAYVQLRKVSITKLSYFFRADGLHHFVHYLMEASPKSNGIGPRQVHLRDIKFGHLDWKEMSPAHAHHDRSCESSSSGKLAWALQRPRSKAQLNTFVSQLESLQKRLPELKVVIFGGMPKGRVAAFRSPLKKEPVYKQDFRYYVIPYPE